MNLWTVVACYNEEKLLPDTLSSLIKQSDQDFSVVVVDNNSSDNSTNIVKEFMAKYPERKIHLIHEKEKGTGAAADSGVRYAISNGATHIARIDADSVASKGWIKHIRSDFENGIRYIGGRVSIRKDEPFYRWYDGMIATPMIRIFERAPRFFYKQPGQKYPIFMAPGLNMAIESTLYIQAGGFPRAAIDDTDEDLVLHLNVAQIIDGQQANLNKNAIVYGSIRRAKSMGYIGTLLWYWGRKRKTDTVDVR